MGYGDDLMASGEARELYGRVGKRIAIGDGRRICWSPVFDNNPIIVRPSEPRGAVAWLDNYPGHRPYIDYAATHAIGLKYGGAAKSRRKAIAAAGRWVFKPYKPVPGVKGGAKLVHGAAGFSEPRAE